jgi:2-methylisocitrate lyase-like PEP mutase family enzyme
MTNDISGNAATATRAELFHRLHSSESPLLVLPNAWDVASARLVEDAGAAAVATTSAGVSWSLGAPDGNHLTRDRALDVVQRVTSAVAVPVTADVETGYGEDDDALAETIRLVIAAGAVGINLEDSGFDPLRDIDEQAHRIEVVRAAADTSGVRLFVNARIDTYLMQAGDPAGRLDETLRRASAFVQAGADGIFVPGVGDRDLVASLVAGIDAPLNILVGPGAPTIAELAALGVRRASSGSSLAQAVYGHARRAAAELIESGTYGGLADPYDYSHMNSLLAR